MVKKTDFQKMFEKAQGVLKIQADLLKIANIEHPTDGEKILTAVLASIIYDMENP